MKKKSKLQKKERKEGLGGKAKRVFISPEIVEEKDFKGVIAVSLVQSVSNILPKTFRV